jgi:hypothetical protein
MIFALPFLLLGAAVNGGAGGVDAAQTTRPTTRNQVRASAAIVAAAIIRADPAKRDRFDIGRTYRRRENRVMVEFQ